MAEFNSGSDIDVMDDLEDGANQSIVDPIDRVQGESKHFDDIPMRMTGFDKTLNNSWIVTTILFSRDSTAGRSLITLFRVTVYLICRGFRHQEVE